MKLVTVLLACCSLFAQSGSVLSKAQRARDLLIAGKPEEALPIYRELANAYPNDPAFLVNLAITEFKTKHYRDASTHAAAAIKLQRDSLAANLFLGASHVELGEYLLAVAPLEKVLAAQPQERNAHLLLAEAFLNLSRYDGAVEHFQQARVLAPEEPKVWYGLGRSFEALSENAFQQIGKDSPESPYWHALQADSYLKQRLYGSAFALYRLALKEGVGLPGLHAGLAVIYRRTGHASWAEIEDEKEQHAALACSTPLLACDFVAGRFQKIVQSTSALVTPEARYWACKAYNQMALESYKQLAQLPPSLELHRQKAGELHLRGLDHEAAEEWREAFKLAPGDVAIGTGLAWSLLRAHEFGGALPILTELLQQHGESRDLNFIDGVALLNLDQPEKAVAPLAVALKLDDRFYPAHAALGQAFLQLGKPLAAIPHLKAALTGDEDASIRFQLLRAYQLTGKIELTAQAKADYQSALTLAETKARLEEGGYVAAP